MTENTDTPTIAALSREWVSIRDAFHAAHDAFETRAAINDDKLLADVTPEDRAAMDVAGEALTRATGPLYSYRPRSAAELKEQAAAIRRNAGGLADGYDLEALVSAVLSLPAPALVALASRVGA